MDSTAPQPIANIPTNSGGNKNVVKIAGIILAVVFVFVLAEVGYYFYNRTGSSTPTETVPQDNLAPALKQPVGEPEYFQKLKFRFDMLTRAGTYLKEATLRYVMDGKVVSTSDSPIGFDGTNYEYRISIQNPKSADDISYYLTAGEIKNLNVSIVYPNGQAIPSRLEEIKEGDFVEIISISNLLSPSDDDTVRIDIFRPE